MHHVSYTRKIHGTMQNHSSFPSTSSMSVEGRLQHSDSSHSTRPTQSNSTASMSQAMTTSSVFGGGLQLLPESSGHIDAIIQEIQKQGGILGLSLVESQPDLHATRSGIGSALAIPKEKHCLFLERTERGFLVVKQNNTLTGVGLDLSDPYGVAKVLRHFLSQKSRHEQNKPYLFIDPKKHNHADLVDLWKKTVGEESLVQLRIHFRTPVRMYQDFISTTDRIKKIDRQLERHGRRLAKYGTSKVPGLEETINELKLRKKALQDDLKDISIASSNLRTHIRRKIDASLQRLVLAPAYIANLSTQYKQRVERLHDQIARLHAQECGEPTEKFLPEMEILEEIQSLEKESCRKDENVIAHIRSELSILKVLSYGRSVQYNAEPSRFILDYLTINQENHGLQGEVSHANLERSEDILPAVTISFKY